MEIWRSHTRGEIRSSIRDKECYCTNEIFMWPSIVFQPAQLAKSMIGAKVWQRAEPLGAHERVDYPQSTACCKERRSRKSRNNGASHRTNRRRQDQWDAVPLRCGPGGACDLRSSPD